MLTCELDDEADAGNPPVDKFVFLRASTIFAQSDNVESPEISFVVTSINQAVPYTCQSGNIPEIGPRLSEESAAVELTVLGENQHFTKLKKTFHTLQKHYKHSYSYH